MMINKTSIMVNMLAREIFNTEYANNNGTTTNPPPSDYLDQVFTLTGDRYKSSKDALKSLISIRYDKGLECEPDWSDKNLLKLVANYESELNRKGYGPVSHSSKSGSGSLIGRHE